MKTRRVIDEIFTEALATLAFLLPLFFLPITSNFYSYNKNILLYAAVLILGLLWLAKLALYKEIKLVKTPFDFPVLLFGIGYGVATFFAKTTRSEIFFTPNATGTIFALILLYFLVSQNINTEKGKRFILYGLTLSASLLGLIAIYQYVGLGSSLTSISWLKAKNWTPTGDSLSLVTYLLVIFPLVSFFKQIQKSITTAAVFGLGSVLITIGLILTLMQIMPTNSTTGVALLPFTTSWAIAVEAFKQYPLYGVGPSNFIVAFSQFRPISYNAMSIWTTRFGQSADFPLQLLTETGILGLLAFILVALKFVTCYRRVIRGKQEELSLGLGIGLIVLFVLSFLLPTNLLLLFVLFVFLGLWAPKEEGSPIEIGFLRQFIWTPLVIGILVAAPLAFFTGKSYLANTYFKKSLDTLAKNDGINTYNFQLAAIKYNPHQSDYHLAFSQTNFALADALARKQNLTDQERNNITQLVQQAIQEAKVATSLSPNSATVWENLSLLYRNLINFAQDADQWTIAAYRQTILLDPVNPQLRVALGGVYYGLKSYELAIRQFESAINLKPDLANAYYNLSASYREEQKYLEAYQAMQLTLNYVPASSSDYQQAIKELNDLAKKLPAQTASSSAKPASKPEEQLSAPKPLPSAAIKPPIQLPEGSAPSVAPTATSTPSPTPTPTTQP